MTTEHQALLIEQYKTAKQVMIEGYRGMHKAPDFLTWNEVQNLQDAMQSAAVELAEYLISTEGESFQIPAPDAAPNPVKSTLLLNDDPNHCQIIPCVTDPLNTFEPNGHENLLRAMFDEPELARSTEDDEALWDAISEASGMSQEEFDKWMDEPFTGAPDDSLVGAVSPEPRSMSDEDRDNEPSDIYVPRVGWTRRKRGES